MLAASIKMTNPIRIFFLVFFCIGATFSSCRQSLKIKLYNDTGFDIDSTRIGNSYIGPIKNNSSVLVENCQQIEMQGDKFFGCATGIIKNKQRDSDCFELCGTGVRTVNKGDFKFDLYVFESDNRYTLRLFQHKNDSR
jgi:hypothetical protein